MSELKIEENKIIARVGETEVTTNKEEVSVKASKIDLVIDAGCDYIIELMKSTGGPNMAISVAENIKAMAELLQVKESIRTLTELLPEKKGDESAQSNA